MRVTLGSVLCILAAAMSTVAKGDEFNSAGVRIHFKEAGQGRPIILIHGQGGSLAAWRVVAPELARDHRVISLDLRGHGASDKPREAAAYGRDMALDIIRLMDHLKLEKAHLVGYSEGANLVAQLMITHPERIATATLGGYGNPSDYPEARAAIDKQEADEMEQECVSRSFLNRMAGPSAPPLGETEFRKQAEACKANQGFDQFAIAAVVRSRKDRVVPATPFANSTPPVLGIVGSLDPALANLRRLQQLRRDLKLVVVDGATHVGKDDVKLRKEFSDAVREFVLSGG